MQKSGLLFLLCWLCQITLASEPKPLPSRIENVTVFLNGAQVTRTANTPLAAGTTYLLFENISAGINTQSIQVGGTGNFTVLSVNHQLNYLKVEKKLEQTQAIETKRDALNEQIETEKIMHEVYRQEESVLLENKKLGSEQQAVKVTDIKETADFFRTRLTEIKKKQQDVKQSIRRLEQQVAQLNAQLTALQNKTEQPTSEITVAVSCKTPTTAKLVLTYLVNEARWLPTYDIRVKDVTSPIAMIYKANVSQNSGEDWSNVKLVISTGNPSQGGSRPILNPWYLGYNTSYNRSISSVSGRVVTDDGSALPSVAISVKGTTIGTTTDASGFYSLQLPANASMLVASFIGYETKEIPISASTTNINLTPDIASLSEVVVVGYDTEKQLQGKVAGVEIDKRIKVKGAAANITPIVATQQTRQTNVEFKIDIPYTIPADGKQYAVDMQEYSAPAYYEYFCAPKLDNDAFLTARITDWEQYNLLAGEANLFFEGTFLGKSLLDVDNTGDTLTLSLGRDKNITVTRIKGKDFSSKQLLGANRTETRSWEINIRNKKNQAINLVVEDQLPVATTKEIEVEKLEVSQAEINNETGRVTWRLALQPAENKKLNLKYAVKYPKAQRVILE